MIFSLKEITTHSPQNRLIHGSKGSPSAFRNISIYWPNFPIITSTSITHIFMVPFRLTLVLVKIIMLPAYIYSSLEKESLKTLDDWTLFDKLPLHFVDSPSVYDYQPAKRPQKTSPRVKSIQDPSLQDQVTQINLQTSNRHPNSLSSQQPQKHSFDQQLHFENSNSDTSSSFKTNPFEKPRKRKSPTSNLQSSGLSTNQGDGMARIQNLYGFQNPLSDQATKTTAHSTHNPKSTGLSHDSN
ncbi:hypothetical protein O181_073590 [Austropuccinia psidii MF-1]|uniref:Uncharacterized protein n=1 Tax=Austropuccinia psidii MF-1 TaxID=1389203 RepID=A0A9Q3IC63_9BASI|nr:hypothetical protein [Austropuccinia psidii MF-1]